MNILIACDSFKDALPALEVCKAVERGLLLANPQFETTCFPMADGGEGTAEVLTFHSKGNWQTVTVNDPLFRPVEARYGLSANGKTAFIEMAAASGLQLLSNAERTATKSTTFGTGELLKDALEKGATRLLLGIGGSATNDCGMGMAAALGYRFFDENGEEVQPVGENLARVAKIDGSLAYRRIALQTGQLQVDVICDVDNPLFGEKGAAHVYARQKGATDTQIQELDAGLQHFGKLLRRQFGQDFASLSGAGAAGGMGAGTAAFLNARLRPGIELVMDYTDFEQQLETTDVVITGEGKIDAQTLHGKLIHGITKRAAAHQIPVIALCGTLDARPKDLQQIGLKSAFSILPKPLDLAEALQQTSNYLTQTAFSIGRLLH